MKYTAFLRNTLMAGSLLLPLTALAAADLGAGVVAGYAPPARDLPSTIIGVINFLLIIVGVLALAYLVYGGFTYITAGGDENKVDQAKLMIRNAIIGIVVIGIAAAVVNFVIDAILVGGR